jgi:hypothetical protein
LTAAGRWWPENILVIPGRCPASSPESIITKVAGSFTARYGVNKLVWFEIYDDAFNAIAREKELKKWRRDRKIRLIEEQNPGWVDLYPEISS